MVAKDFQGRPAAILGEAWFCWVDPVTRSGVFFSAGELSHLGRFPRHLKKMFGIFGNIMQFPKWILGKYNAIV